MNKLTNLIAVISIFVSCSICFGFTVDTTLPNLVTPEFEQYAPDPDAADQGAADTSNITLFNIVDDQGIVPYFTSIMHHDRSGSTTQYTVASDLDLSSYVNMRLYIENGAQFYVNSGVTLTLPANPDQITAFNDFVIGPGTVKNYTWNRQVYYPSHSIADHGASSVGSTKWYLDQIGSKNAELEYWNSSGGVNTAYTFTTAETIPSNVTIEFENGAMLSPNSGVTISYGCYIDSGLTKIFAGDGAHRGTADFSMPETPIEWFGGVGDASTDNTAAFNSALAFYQVDNRVPAVKLNAGQYKLTTSGVTMDRLGQSILGVGRLASLIYFNTTNENAITVSGVEQCKIQDIGFVTTAGGGLITTAIRLDNAPTTTLRDVYVDGYEKGFFADNSWNTSVDNCYMAGIRGTGIDWTANSNDTNFRNVIIDGDSAAGTLGYNLSAAHGVSIIGGAIEDCDYGVKTAGVELSYDGYMEGIDVGEFYITDSSDKVVITNLYAFLNDAGSNRDSIIMEGGICTVLQANYSDQNGTDWDNLFALTGGAKAFYGNISCATGMDIGTCVTGSGGRINPIHEARRQNIITEKIDLNVDTNDKKIYLGSVSRPWKIGRFARFVEGGSPTLASATVKLGTDSDDDVFLEAANITNTAIDFFSGVTQTSIPYTNETGWLFLTVEQSSATTGTVQFYIEIIDGYSGNSHTTDLDTSTQNKQPIPLDLLL